MLVLHAWSYGQNYLTLGQPHKPRGCCLTKLRSVGNNCGPVAADQFAAVFMLDVGSKTGSKAAFLPMPWHPIPTPDGQSPSPQTTQVYMTQAARRSVSRSLSNLLTRPLLDCLSDCGSLHTPLDCNYELPASQQTQPHMLLHSASMSKLRICMSSDRHCLRVHCIIPLLSHQALLSDA